MHFSSLQVTKYGMNMKSLRELTTQALKNVTILRSYDLVATNYAGTYLAINKSMKDFFAVLALSLILNGPLFAQNQAIPNDPVTESMTQYLHALNGGDVSEDILMKQLGFMQKVRNLWATKKFQDLRQLSLKDIIEKNIGHDLFISAVAFHNESVESAWEHRQEYQIPENKKNQTEQVLRLLERACQFREELRRFRGITFNEIHELQAPDAPNVIQNDIRLAFAPTNDHFAILYKRKVTMWDQHYGSVPYQVYFRSQVGSATSGSYHDIYFHHSGRQILTYDVNLDHSPKWTYFLKCTSVDPTSPIYQTHEFIATEYMPLSLDGMTVHPQKNILAFCKNRDGSIYIDDLTSSSRKASWFDEQRGATHTEWGPLSFSPDGNILAAGIYHCEDETLVGNIDIWDVETGKILHTLEPLPISDPLYSNTEPVYLNSLAFGPDGKFLLSLLTGMKNKSWYHIVTLWDLQKGVQKKTLQFFPGLSPKSIVFTPDGKYFLIGFNTGEIKRYDIADLSEMTIGHHPQAGEYGPGIDAMVFNSKGNLLASGDYTGKVLFWLVNSDKAPDLGLIYLGTFDH